MRDWIRLSRSAIAEEEKQAVLSVLDKGYLGMGTEVMQFEQELEQFFSNKVSVVCVNTGTSALHLAIQACGIGLNDEVIVPSITYVASFQAISATGATPIACDIDLKTGCIDIEDARSKITRKTKAIMHVHYAGGVGNRSQAFDLAKEFKLRVIEDAAHSFGGKDGKSYIGEEGDITCFSFDGIKNITCGEGGAVVSSDQQLIATIKDLRLLGVERDSEQRYSGKRSWRFNVTQQGWRYHMSNLYAAIGRAQLRKINEFAIQRRKLAQLYKQNLSRLSLEFFDLDLNQVIPHIFPVLVSHGKRDALRDYLLSKKIETGIHYQANHLLTKYKQSGCPRSEYFSDNILTLPLHVNLTDEDIKYITMQILDFLKHEA
ncbi:MAG: DegT/DnrJ/EryC1/StrS family aminotransferase [Candidatus Paracaedibacteraceae bacterium]|nr:DegT/DnrJ/EryC1/StrS family aminotransferase [Candidatus Paracaedibacteraceae bacterium]